MNRSTGRCIAAALAAGVVALGVAVVDASGGISGPCSASLAGTNVAGNGTGATAKPIVVAHGASVPIVMSSSGQLTHVRINLEFAGISWAVKDKAVKTPVYRDTIPVNDYAKYGVGLYKVTGTGTGPGVTCSGAALVRVKGSALTSYAGIGAIAATLLGVAGVVLAGLGSAAHVSPFRVAFGAIAGLIAALGVLVLLQEAAILYPTMLVAIVGLALGVGVGTVVALRPALGHAATAGKTGSGVTGTPAAPGV